MTLELQSNSCSLLLTVICSGLLLKNQNNPQSKFQLQEKKKKNLVSCVVSMFSVNNKYNFINISPLVFFKEICGSRSCLFYVISGIFDKRLFPQPSYLSLNRRLKTCRYFWRCYRKETLLSAICKLKFLWSTDILSTWAQTSDCR